MMSYVLECTEPWMIPLTKNKRHSERSIICSCDDAVNCPFRNCRVRVTRKRLRMTASRFIHFRKRFLEFGGFISKNPVSRLMQKGSTRSVDPKLIKLPIIANGSISNPNWQDCLVTHFLHFLTKHFIIWCCAIFTLSVIMTSGFLHFRKTVRCRNFVLNEKYS